MKIAVLVWGIVNEGGTQRQALNLASQLKSLGHSVCVGTFFYLPSPDYEKLLQGVELVNLYGPGSPELAKEMGLVKVWQNQNFILRFISLKWRAAKFAKELARRLPADAQIVNPHDGMYRTALAFVKLHPNSKSLWMANDIHSLLWTAERFEKKVSIFGKICRKVVDYFESKKVRNLNKIVVLDNINKKVLKKYYGGEAVVVRSGVDAKRFVFSPHHLPEKNRELKLLLTGILAPHRRYQDVILAVKILKAKGLIVKLDIIGRYSEADSYKQQLDRLIIQENLTSDIRFVGRVSEEELFESYKNHHIFIFPNHNQTWGLAVFEAMASGMPALVSKTCGASEVLTDEVNALIVNPKAPEEIAEKIIRLSQDPELYASLSTAASVFVRENITWEKYAKNMAEIMKAI